MKKPPIQTILLLLSVAYGLYMTFLNVDKSDYMEAKEIELRRERSKFKESRDSLKIASKALGEERLLAIKEMQKVTQEANMKVAKAEKIIYEYSKIKPVVSRNDAERDSLLSAVLN